MIETKTLDDYFPTGKAFDDSMSEAQAELSLRIQATRLAGAEKASVQMDPNATLAQKAAACLLHQELYIQQEAYKDFHPEALLDYVD